MKKNQQKAAKETKDEDDKFFEFRTRLLVFTLYGGDINGIYIRVWIFYLALGTQSPAFFRPSVASEPSVVESPKVSP